MNLKSAMMIKTPKSKIPMVEIIIFLDKNVKGNAIIRKFINAILISI